MRRLKKYVCNEEHKSVECTSLQGYSCPIFYSSLFFVINCRNSSFIAQFNREYSQQNFTQFHTITQLPFLTIAVYMEIFAPVLFWPFLPSLSFGQILNWINLRLFFNYCVNYKRACIIYNILNVQQTLIQGEIVCKSKRAKKAGRKLSCIQYAF